MGVLDGIRVLEMARVPPAEMPGMFLADMGAEVLKIETPPEEPEGAEARRRAAFAYVNRNKRSLALNMKDPAGQAIFRRLAADADVIVEGFRPGVMKRLGGDYETLSADNPRLVYCSLSGFGQNGPYRDFPAHDGNYLSLAGVLGLIGEPGPQAGVPAEPGRGLRRAPACTARSASCSRCSRASAPGAASIVDVSYLDTSLALLAATPNMRFFWSDGMAPKRGEGFLGGSYPYYAVYETKDDKLLTIGCTEPWLWANFCRAIGHPEYVKFARQPDQFVRAANAEEVKARETIEAIIRTRTRDEWYPILAAADVCVGKVYEPEEVPNDPQVRARDMVVEIAPPGPWHRHAVRSADQAVRNARLHPDRGAILRRAHR